MSDYNDKFLQDTFNEINYYKNLMTLTRGQDRFFYFRDNLRKICNDLYNIIEFRRISYRQQFTLEELANYNGENGKLAYVAVDGIVYDVTSQNLWVNGTHSVVSAGKDLTSEYKTCHNGSDILKRLRIVGVLK